LVQLLVITLGSWLTTGKRKGIIMKVANKDPGKRHFYISLVKSGVRIVAGIALFMGGYAAAGVLFIGAELLGIAEEL